MTTEFIKTNSILHSFLRELRDIEIQNDSMRFRTNIERIGEIMAYELSKTLDYTEENISTPLGQKSVFSPANQPVIATILRAGLPLHQGVLNYFDKAESCFISAFRKHTNETEFEVEIEYLSSPYLEGKTLILCDPMLATGASMILAYKAAIKNGVPKKVHILSVVSSPEGLAATQNFFPENTDFWIGEIDSHLNDKSYIVPGLGDAGDLTYGPKL